MTCPSFFLLKDVKARLWVSLWGGRVLGSEPLRLT